MDFFGLGGGPAKPEKPQLPEISAGVVAGSVWKGPQGSNPLRHTILGAGTVFCKAFRKALAERDPTAKCRLVKATGVPKQLFESDETYKCDFEQAAALDYVIQGSCVVYCMHEFEFDQTVWKAKWPKFMRAVLDACIKHKAKLVFVQFNPYVYSDSAVGNMVEDSEQEPSSVKGKVCKEVTEMLLQDVAAGRVVAMVVRTAELFGPWIKSKDSMLMVLIYKRLRLGGVAEWPYGCDVVQTFSYVPDVAKAIALLADTPDCFNQIWHAPATRETYNACEWTILFADALGVKHSSPAPGTCKVGTHDRDLPEDEVIAPEDDEATQKAKKDKTKAREEKAKQAREKRQKERVGLPELNITLLYESYIWAQSLFSAHFSELRDTSHLHKKDAVFNCDKFCKRFDFRPTEAATACAEIVLEEGTALTLKAQQEGDHV